MNSTPEGMPMDGHPPDSHRPRETRVKAPCSPLAETTESLGFLRCEVDRDTRIKRDEQCTIPGAPLKAP